MTKLRHADAIVYVIVSSEKITPVRVTLILYCASFKARTGSLNVKHIKEIIMHIATVQMSKLLRTAQKENSASWLTVASRWVVLCRCESKVSV